MDGRGIGEAMVGAMAFLVVIALLVGAVLALVGLWLFHHVHLSFGLR